MSNLVDSLDGALARMTDAAEEARQFRGRIEVLAAQQPQTITCKNHPHVVLHVDLNATLAASWKATVTSPQYKLQGYADVLTMQYASCGECWRDKKRADEQGWLHAAGVPALLTGATLMGFNVESDNDLAALAAARQFIEVGKGFLIMTGNPGDGKSFLAAAIMRVFGRGKWVEHNDLLIQLRQGYGQRTKDDVLLECQEARLLVLDEVGFSAGGADDQPMLHHVLNHRHNEQLPTIITSNLTWPQVNATLGKRMEERLKQSLFRHVQFLGQSHRPRLRAEYLSQ